MLKVVYDEQIFMGQRYGGISRYFVEIGSRISRFPDHQVTVFAPTYINQFLREAEGLQVFGVGVRKSSDKGYFPGAGRLKRLLEPSFFGVVRPDIVHETYFLKGDAKKYAPTIVTVHDMIHELFPQFFDPDDRTRELKRLAVRKADRIICVSNSTRRDLLELLDVCDDKVTVVYHGGPSDALASSACQPLVGQPYLLHVGARVGYKNFASVLEAFAGSPRLRKDFLLVCCGGGRFTKEEIDAWCALGLSSRHFLYFDGGSRVLAALYTYARALIYPSLYEGFGIPPLEAMGFGCPVICGSTSSIPEVVGAAAITCDTRDVDELRQAMEDIVSDDSLRADVVERGYQRAAMFSWDRCAEQTAAVYRQIIG